VLRELVAERFGVSELLTSLFMSINMVGAVLAAPLAGALADRFGRRPRWIAAALVLDALCFFGLTRDVPFAVFLGIRFVEGAAHIFALSLLLGRSGGGPTLGFGGPELEDVILREIRLPRTLLALLVGGTLGLCGAALQGLLRNPLAEPGLLGASSGAVRHDPSTP